MSKWDRSVTAAIGGRFQIVFTRVGIADPLNPYAGTPTDVTFFRGAPTELENYSSGDPFGDSVASMTFPKITGFDDFDSPELGAWLSEFANVDIWWIPGIAAAGVVVPPGTADADIWLDLNSRQALAPVNNWTLVDGVYVKGSQRGKKVFEGYVASLELSGDGQGSGLQIQCQGANFQADRYLMKPFYPPNPQTLESLIAVAFDHGSRPHLRTSPFVVEWPDGWTQVAPAYDPVLSNVYAPNVAPGTKWTGYTSRSTGAWDRSLTGFVQDQISVMITQVGVGVPPGNQWTLMLAHQGDAKYPAGRTPVLRIRDRFRAPDFSVWFGSDGLSVDLTKDSTQTANLVYGDGTDVSGTVWRNAVIAGDGSRTDYQPLASSQDVYPPINNPLFNEKQFASEAYVKFGTGFNQKDAVVSAGQTLRRDLDAGWAGTMTITLDPPEMSRWEIEAGMTFLLRGWAGTGITGMRFHISAAEMSVREGTVRLTIDTRYRDLLNLSEALARARDPLTPSKLLQLNRASAIIEDVQAPWDYSAGSGYVPLASKGFYDYLPAGQAFPYQDWVQKHPPFIYPSWYVGVSADSADSQARWSGPIPILTAEKGTIARAEFFCVDQFGQPVLIPFHVSLYYVNVTVAAMPQMDGEYSPFITGAFESIDPATGQPWAAGILLKPQKSMIIAWGNQRQPAGFSPGIESAGNSPTGLLEDDSTWTFDNTNNPQYNKLASAGQHQLASAVTIYAMFYAQTDIPVYFQGRLFKQPQGA